MSDGEGSTPHVEKIAGEIIAKDAAKDAKKGRPGKGVAVAATEAAAGGRRYHRRGRSWCRHRAERR